MSVNRLRINNERFSEGVCEICDMLGLTTVGQLNAIIDRMKPNAKLYTQRGKYLRVFKVRREVERLERKYKETRL
jgi:hypothetical protein